jgi:hypothetical protein
LSLNIVGGILRPFLVSVKAWRNDISSVVRLINVMTIASRLAGELTGLQFEHVTMKGERQTLIFGFRFAE